MGSASKLLRTSPEVRTPVGPKPGLRPRSGLGRTLVSRHKLRRISSGSIRTSPGPRRTSPGPSRTRTKDLVSVSRHKLRRISPGPTRTSPGPRRTSPGPTRTSPGPTRTRTKDLVSVSRHKLRRISPGLTRTTPGPSKTSPGPTRTSPGPSKTRTKDLVSVSRHKLRRISPGPTRTSPGPSKSSPEPTRTSPGPSRSKSLQTSALAPGSEFRSRFKMDKRNLTRTRSHDLSYKNRRVQTARSFLQSRLRPLPSSIRHASRASSAAHMCWIRGSLFRVSANRLSRAPPPRRCTGPAPLSPASSTSRHLARWVLQRSLSVARSSAQKQRQRQFCMFYNRFGRCNRGTECPFTHDPEKVAVCTRFLRGRCKQGDNCPFSHKVSKDKMPVCRFFLRGVCSHSECPYSHVYVSRNAQVCDHFLQGYCALGQKCKKKHTLICPDKNCSRGDACKLQHKRPVRHSAAKKSRPHGKRSKPQTPDPAAVHSSSPESGPGSGPFQKLPSFISLCSSPEEPDIPPGGAVLSRGTLQIKPRFENQDN